MLFALRSSVYHFFSSDNFDKNPYKALVSKGFSLACFNGMSSVKCISPSSNVLFSLWGVE